MSRAGKRAIRAFCPPAFLDKPDPRPLERHASSRSLRLAGRVRGWTDCGNRHVSYAREPGREGFGELVSLYLLPEAMGRGYGRSLMEAVLQRLREDGCDGVCLWVLDGNRQAQDFYRHMGFYASGRSQKELFGGEETELVEMVLLWEH